MKFKLRENHPYSKILSSDIPCSQTTESKCDLLLLDGDVGKSTEDSKVVINALALIDKYIDSNTKPFQCLVGPSGCGKTKACFDILKKRFGIYFDFSGHDDIATMKIQLDILIKKYPRSIDGTRIIRQQREFEEESLRLVHLLLLSRLLVLFSMLERNKSMSPKEWLFFQLNGLPSNSSEVFLDLVSTFWLEIEFVIYYPS
jgi:hypothetical protein